MKKIIFIFLTVATIAICSCNDDFMERYPTTSLTEETVFGGYSTFPA